MRVRRWNARRRNPRLLAALCVTMVVATGCQQIGNVETIRYGREYSEDGTRLRVAALQPRCGCVSLANVTQQPVWLESWFYEIPRGSAIVEPGERRRFLFDWAGAEASDFYELVAFRVADQNGVRVRDDGEQGGLLIQNVMAEYTALALMGCDDPTCEFGTLGMNRALHDTSGSQQQAAARQRGVNYASVIEVAAPLNRCGCMMLRNTSPASSVTLRATRHGATTGQITLRPLTTIPVPFDWGGPLDNDLYVIDAVAVGEAPPSGSMPGAQVGSVPGQPLVGVGVPPGGEPLVAPPAMTIRIRDYISLVGQLVDMSCTPEYAEFRAQLTTPQPDAPDAPEVAPPGTAADVVPADLIQCPWMPGGRPVLGMSVAYDPGQTIVRSPPMPIAPEPPAPTPEPPDVEPSPGP